MSMEDHCCVCGKMFEENEGRYNCPKGACCIECRDGREDNEDKN